MKITLKSLVTGLILITTMVLLIAGCGGQGQKQKPPEPTKTADPAKKAGDAQLVSKVTLRIPWKMTGDYTPFQMGVDKGFYKEEGLEVTVAEGESSGSTVNLIANKSDTFGYADAGVVAKGIASGRPLKVIMVIYQKSPIAVISLKESGISKPADLIGKRIGAAPGGSPAVFLPAFLKANKISPDQVKLASIGGPALVPSLLEKKVDAIVSYAYLQVPPIKAQGFDVNVINFADYGVSPLNLALFAHQDVLKENPEMVRKFVKATIKSWEEAIKNPKESVETAKKTFPAIDVAVQEQVLKDSFPLLHTKHTEGKPIGWQAKEDWEATQELLIEYFGLEKKLPIDTYYTNEFFPRL